MSIDTSKVATTNSTAATASKPSKVGAAATWADDRLGLATHGQEEPAQGLPGPLVVHAGRDRAVELRRPAAQRRVPHAVVQPEHGRDDLRGQLRPAARHRDVGGLRLDAAALLRRPWRPADAADPPLGGDAVRRLDDDPPAAGLLHRRAPQAARAQLGDRRAAAAARHARGVHRLLAPRRPALRHRHPRRGRLPEVPADRRHLHVVLPLRRRVPRQRHHPAPVHHPHPADPRPAAGPDHRAHAAARLPQAHPVARARPHRAERRRLPDAARLRRQGRWVLLHRLRHHAR